MKEFIESLVKKDEKIIYINNVDINEYRFNFSISIYKFIGGINMINNCVNCTKKMTCDNPSEETTDCKDFMKMRLETEITRKLVMADGLNYKFERIDE
jgi:hypothetical protein